MIASWLRAGTEAAFDVTAGEAAPPEIPTKISAAASSAERPAIDVPKTPPSQGKLLQDEGSAGDAQGASESALIPAEGNHDCHHPAAGFASPVQVVRSETEGTA
jgi:hypothetical protein